MFNELSARIMTWATAARDDEAGQGLVEYALILALVSVVVDRGAEAPRHRHRAASSTTSPDALDALKQSIRSCRRRPPAHRAGGGAHRPDVPTQ